MEETFKGCNSSIFSLNFSWFLFFVFQILTIPVKAVIAVGSLTCSPKHVFLPPSFPVRELGHGIKCFIAVSFICLSFSRETTVLNCCMSNCWRDCAAKLLRFSLLLFFGVLFSPPMCCKRKLSYVSSTAHWDGVLEC